MKPATLLVPALLLSAVACNSSGFSQPKASEFSQGGCRAVAPSVLDLGRDLHGLSTKTPDGSQRDALKNHQAHLRARQPALPVSLAPTVQHLVTAVGLLRLRTDTQTYAPALAQDAMAAYGAVLAACTTA